MALGEVGEYLDCFTAFGRRHDGALVDSEFIVYMGAEPSVMYSS